MKHCRSELHVRIECSTCLEVGDARLLRVETQSATFGCAHCGAETTAVVAPEVAAKTSSAAPVPSKSAQSEAETCPKCERAVPQACLNCPSCGLTREKFSGYAAEGPSAAPELRSAWGRVEAGWNRDSTHEDFAAEVALSGNYRLGALWYRQAASSADRAQKANQMLDRMQSMATAALMSTKPKVEEEKQPYKNVVILLMVLLFVGAGVGIVLMSKGVETVAPPIEPTFQAPGRR